MNIPNILTVIRFIIIPFMGYYLFREQYTMGIILFTAGGLTDILDGYIARKYNMITSWGKLADPIADKLMQVTALSMLTIKGFIPFIVVGIVIVKESFMGVGTLQLYKKENTVVAANWYGKLATVIFYFAIVMTIIFKIDSFKNDYTNIMVNIFVTIAVISTLYAFFMYSLTYRKIRKESN